MLLRLPVKNCYPAALPLKPKLNRMKTLIVLIASLIAFITQDEKAICTAPVVPVCFNQAVPGSPYCEQHKTPIQKPCAYSFVNELGHVVHCMYMAVAGSDYCAGHIVGMPPALK